MVFSGTSKVDQEDLVGRDFKGKNSPRVRLGFVYYTLRREGADTGPTFVSLPFVNR